MARQPFPFAFSKTKSPDIIRIFVFGESAAFGDPQPEFGLPRMLEALLSAHYPGAKFEVINAAMTAINSHVVRQIARDCASSGGDLWVIYMGNNEVVGPYGAGTIFGSRAPSLALVRASLALKASRTGQFLEWIIQGLQKKPAGLQAWGGMQMFLHQQVRQDDPGMAVVYDSFRRNLADILSVGRTHGAKMVVSTVASNLKDCAPFASLHRLDLLEGELAKWEKLNQNGIEAQQAGRFGEALDLYRQAAAIDDSFADAWFRCGQCCVALGREAEAVTYFKGARDRDTLRFRCDSRLNAIIRQAAAGREGDGVALADASEGLAQEGPRGSAEPGVFYEHVHLTFEGNYRLALAIAEQSASLLPEQVRRLANAGQPWPSIEDCARRLAWTDVSRQAALSQMFNRLNDPPFTTQLNHNDQMIGLRRQLEQSLPAVQPAGLDRAAGRCREALALAPNDWALHKEFARLQQKLADYQGAAESWRRVVDLLPHYAEGWQELGVVLELAGRDGEAASAFERALQLDPGSAPATTGLAQVCARQGKHAEAIAHYEAVLKLKPYWGPAHLGLGKELEASGHKEAAEVHFRQALQNRINTSLSYSALGQFCFERGWYPQAATNFMDSLRLNPADAVTHVNLGVVLGLMGRPAEARGHYAEATRLDPKLPEAHARLGLEFGREGNDAGAVEQFSEAVRLKPDLIEARVNLGIALAKQERVAEAREQFLEVLRRSPTNAMARHYVQTLH